MKQVYGVWLPDSDTHHEVHLAHGPFIDGRGTYQHRKYAAALKHFKGRGLALDIGGHVGFWSMLMARDFERVVAFEPLPQHVQCFRRNLADRDNVILHETAIGEEFGTVSMLWDRSETGSSHVVAGGEDATDQVAIRPLDSCGFVGVDFIKIDVEGYELPVVLGGEATIRRERPAIVIEQKPKGTAERYGRGRFDALDVLKGWGAGVAWEIGGDFLVTWA